MLGVVEMSGGVLRCTEPDEPAAALGANVERTDRSFELSRLRPETRPCYFRVGYGRLEWGGDPTAFLPAGARPTPEPGALLAMVHGQAAPPDSTPLPGVRRLTPGTRIRVDADGVTVTQGQCELPPVEGSLARAVTRALASAGDEYVLAYSGGLASAFLAVLAVAAGHRVHLVHADLGLPGTRQPPAPVPGGTPRRVALDLHELLDHHTVSGTEPLPPLPDFEVPGRLHGALAGAAGLPLVTGALLESLVSVKLPDVPRGTRAWRLLGCEPFHISGTLGTLGEALELLDNRVVYTPGRRDTGGSGPDAQQLGAPPPPSPTGGSKLPWLTAEGKQAYETTHRGSMAVWQDRLDAAKPVIGRIIGGLEERGTAGAFLPALDTGVLAAAAALPARRLGRIRRGVFENHLPLRRAVAAAGVTGLRTASPGHWLRLAAAAHLHRERRKIVSELERECALGDLGLVEPRLVAAGLREGRDISSHALPLLRLVWLDRWLRERS